MAKFQVMEGKHFAHGPKGPSTMYVKGSIVCTKANLLKLNSRGSIKFKKISDEPCEPFRVNMHADWWKPEWGTPEGGGMYPNDYVHDPNAVAAVDSPEEEDEYYEHKEEELDDGLDSLTVAELKQLAGDSQVEIPAGLKNKAKILDILRKSGQLA